MRNVYSLRIRLVLCGWSILLIRRTRAERSFFKTFTNRR
jgi:hypothetical protein